MGEGALIVALSELAARVQRGRSTEAVLRIAGDGLNRLGVRFVAFEVDGNDLVVRHVATAPARLAAIETIVGRKLRGLRAPIAACAPAAELLARRHPLYRADLDLFDRFVRAATGQDVESLDQAPATAGITNGVLAPVFVREQPWGLVSAVSPTFRADDAAAMALFATHVGSALEVADFSAALARMQRELVERERLAALGELAAIVAHEVRHPLAVIFSALGSLRRHPSAIDSERLLRIVGEEAKRLDAIASDLLALGRPAVIVTRLASLGDVVEDVASAAAARPEAEGIDVRLELSPDLPPVDLDPRLVRQALFNLAMNGLQAMTPEVREAENGRSHGGGTLTLRTRADRRGDRAFACIDVADTGCGIPLGDERRVFEPFFTTKETGSGLGLPLVKRVVDAHRGEIDVASGTSGTTFTMRVPVVAMAVC